MNRCSPIAVCFVLMVGVAVVWAKEKEVVEQDPEYPYWYTRHGIHHPSAPCHNASGTCMPNGTFICLNLQVVDAKKRCDGVIDCDDTTDEYLCELPPYPRSNHSKEDRHFSEQFSMSRCIGCECLHGAPVPVYPTHPWYKEGLTAGPTGVLSSFTPKGLGCNPALTSDFELQLYRKTGYCKMAVCCARQSLCDSCSSGAPRARKCYR